MHNAGAAIDPEARSVDRTMTEAPCPFCRPDRGRILTDECLRVRGMQNVWAAGDCAAVPHPGGGACPQLAHYAAAGGTRIAWNIRRVLAGG